MYISEMELLPNTKYELLSIHKSAINQWLKLVLLLFHRAGGRGGDQNKNSFSYIGFFSTGAEWHFDGSTPSNIRNGDVKQQQALVRTAQGWTPSRVQNGALIPDQCGFLIHRMRLCLRNVQAIILESRDVPCVKAPPHRTPDPNRRLRGLMWSDTNR